MDPEDLREVISTYQKCVAETVQRFGGFVAKYMGGRPADISPPTRKQARERQTARELERSEKRCHPRWSSHRDHDTSLHMVPRQSLTTLPQYDEMVTKQDKLSSNIPRPHAVAFGPSDNSAKTCKLFQINA
jgi:hypothetical protein